MGDAQRQRVQVGLRLEDLAAALKVIVFPVCIPLGCVPQDDADANIGALGPPAGVAQGLDGAPERRLIELGGGGEFAFIPADGAGNLAGPRGDLREMVLHVKREYALDAGDAGEQAFGNVVIGGAERHEGADAGDANRFAVHAGTSRSRRIVSSSTQFVRERRHVPPGAIALAANSAARRPS